MIDKKILTTLGVVAAVTGLQAQTVLDENVTGISRINSGTPVGGVSFGHDIFVVDSDLDLADLTGPDFILEGPTYVSGAKLTVPPGTIVRGQPRELATSADAPGALIITRTGQIDAVGTPSNPIIFTTAADPQGNKWQIGDSFLDADPQNSPLLPIDTIDGSPTKTINLWGGIGVLGNAPTNADGGSAIGLSGFEVTVPEYKDNIEGIAKSKLSIYGGFNPNDSSGQMAYCSIRHTGDALVPNEELQGLTVGGLGMGTRLDHIDIYVSGDDGIEVFGGTNNFKNIVISYADDDGFDLDQGWVGLTQFLLVVLPDNELFAGFGGDKGGEWDGVDGDSLDFPLMAPTIYNMTMIGAGVDGGTNDVAIEAKEAFGGFIYNSIVTNFEDGALSILDSASALFTTSDRFTNGTAEFSNNVFWNCFHDGTTFVNTVAAFGLDATAEGIIDNSVGTNEGNVIATPNILGVSQGSTPGSFGSNTLNPVLNTIDANNFVGVVAGNQFGEPITSTFFDQAGYKGAFSDEKSEALWSSGWTALNILGVLVDNGNGDDIL